MAEQRIPRVDDSTTPEASKAILDELKKKFGRAPNIFATVAHSPAALQALTGLIGSLAVGSLSPKEQEALALRVGQMHGCQYCSAAHTAKAKMLGAELEETIAWRKGESDDSRIKAIIDLAAEMVEQRGQVSDASLARAEAAGLNRADLIEVVAGVVVNTFTNYINALVKTEVDFPAAPEV